MNNEIKNTKRFKTFPWAQPTAPTRHEGEKYLSPQARESVTGDDKN